MRYAIAALLLAAPAAAQVVEDFEHGNLGLYTAIPVTGGLNLTLNAASAHDGALGAEFMPGSNPAWRYNAGAATAPGNVYRAYVRLRGGVNNNGRSYLGVGATPTGAWSAVFSPNTGQIILQNNSAAYNFVTAATAAFVPTADVWYQIELDWASNGDMVVSILDEAGTSVLASTPSFASGYVTPGGLALRGFTTSPTAFHDLDTVCKKLDVAVTDCIPGTFVDISGSGTALNLSDDGEVDIATSVGNALFAAGTARVGSNGGVRFSGGGTELGFTNGSLPNDGVFDNDQTLLGFWDDFDTGSGAVGNIYWQEIGSTLYIQWNNAGFFLDAVNRATFQIQVHANGPAYAQFVYADIENARAAGGGSATIGYQGGNTCTNTVQYLFNAPNGVKNGSVVSVTDRDTLVFSPDMPCTWIEISGTGTPLNLADDGEVDIAHTVNNAIISAGTARVGSNGGVRFSGAGAELGFTNQPIPSIDAFNGSQTLLPFWDDVNTVGGTVGNIYWRQFVGGPLVVQWENVGFFSTPATERATFQLQVHPTGNVLAQFLYRNIEGTRAARGGSATIGYQSGAVNGNAQWSFDSASVSNNGCLSLVRAGRKIGASYCSSNPNSTGQISTLVLTGTASVGANDLRMTAHRLPLNAFGYFLASLSTGFVPNAGGSQGNLCLSGNIGRGVGAGVLNSGGTGSFTSLVNLTAIPQPGGGPVVALPGETWNFQAWHRDSVGGVATSNLTNPAQVQLLP